MLLNEHLDSAFNLARWLSGNDQDAQDIVQEACVRVLKFAHTFRGENGRAWLLSVVRNTGYTWLKQNRSLVLSEEIDRLVEAHAAEEDTGDSTAIRRLELDALAKALAALPVEFREVIVLREIEELSYREIAQVLELPMGTVMSRLARARAKLLESAGRKGGGHGMP